MPVYLRRIGLLALIGALPTVALEAQQPVSQTKPPVAIQKKNPSSRAPVKAPQVPEVIRAQSFEIVDSQGRMRGLFGAGSKGAGIGVFGTDGKARIGMISSDGGDAAIEIYDKDGLKRIGLDIGSSSRQGLRQGLPCSYKSRFSRKERTRS